MPYHCSRCKNTSYNVKPTHQWEEIPPLSNFLGMCYYDYLCVDCINEIGNNLIELGTIELPRTLIKGEHFYIENGKWVFTEKYHLLKGYCCNNGCRHCPYGYKN